MDPILPMLAVASEPFDSPQYSFEVKWDGIRALAAVKPGARCQLWGRDGTDYTPRYPDLAAVLPELPTGTILDGELVWFVDGQADFAGLLRRHQLVSPRKIRWAAAWQPVTYMLFDILQLKGRSLLNTPLRERRVLLAELLAQPTPNRLLFSSGVTQGGRQFFQNVIDQGHEGVMAKHLDSCYRPGKRSAAWRKIKPRTEVVCVIVGYQTSRTRIDSLLLAAQYAGKLRYVGQVGLGPNQAIQRELGPQLSGLACTKPLVPHLSSARWVRPELYCLVHCFDQTSDGRLRFPCLRRLLRPPDDDLRRQHTAATPRRAPARSGT
jgi:DNA ligase D-like protein (predicted ligase)